MRLTAQADYAVVMMTAAARHCGVSGRLNATMLSDDTGIPLPTVQKLVSRLSSAGLIESARGTGGGFRLARPAAAISLADIIEAVEGPIAMTACVEQGRHDCAIEESCHVKPHWNVVNGAVKGALAGVSLASLASVRPELVEGPSFTSSVANKDRASTSSARTVMEA
ncbi:MAG: SUF system Fe-S cluster assembly regulator [Sphingomonas sp.]